MQITVYAFNDQLVPVQVEEDTSVELLKAIVEADCQIPAAQQALIFNNAILANNATMGSAGIKDGDVIQMAPARQQQQGGGAGGAGGSNRQQAPQHDRRLDVGPDGAALSPMGFLAAMKESKEQMAALEGSLPELAKAIREEDVSRMQELLKTYHGQRKAASEREAAASAEEEELYRRVAADPFDVEAQRRIEEIINQKNIEENFMHAMEHNPEVFAQVCMLYVDMEVNGVHVKAFIDSGAQMSIMTSSFVEQCFLGRLVDKRWQGMAVGVGSSKIIGRVHQAPLKVGGHFLTSSITVLEQKGGPQFIFGLDNLKRHQCCIDLKKGVLHFGSIGVDVPFLPESQIPKDASGSDAIEPVSEQEAAQSMSQAVHGGGEQGTAVAAGGGSAGNAGGATAAAAPGSSSPRAPAPFAYVPPPPRAQLAPTPAPGGAAASTGAAPGSTTAAGGVDPAVQAAVAQLTGLGFTEQQALAALAAAGGNVETAAALLFGS